MTSPPPSSPLARLAGPAALAAGALMVGAQLVMLPFDPKDHVATSTDPVFQIGGAFYLLGFAALLVTVVTASLRQLHRAGRFGVVATIAALLGTFLLGGDLWFETFAVPWIADQAPGTLETDPTIVLALGAFASYIGFALGWLLFGIASFRARVFPRTVSVSIAIAGIIGFNALLAPFGIPLGLAVAALGVWLVRHPGAGAEVEAPFAVPALERV